MRINWYLVLVAFVAGEVIGLLLYIVIKNCNFNHKNNYINYANNFNQYGENAIPIESLYEYYNVKNNGGNISLIVGEETFFLNGKPLTILGGSIHYFRVHPKYWRDRLKKLRAMGANTVETYIPWNLHEPEKDHYDFGKEVSGTDYPFSEWLDVFKFIQMAKEEDLFVIIRPGPYICSEWEFGGLPSYLLNYTNIKIRSNDPNYLERVDKYFDQLLPRFSIHQIKYGGPILIFQIENEYGLFAEVGSKDHLKFLKSKMEESNINGLFVTSGTVGGHGSSGALLENDVLITANFFHNGQNELTALKTIQPLKAAMVMEFWSGWFDYWGSGHSTVNTKEFAENLKTVLEFPASVNFYMFHGGTSFGFMNGAFQEKVNNINVLKPITSSYDYDAPLSENGDYTKKYFLARDMFVKKLPLGLKIPDPPKVTKTEFYKPIKIVQWLNWNDIISSVFTEDEIKSKILMPMESLPLLARKGEGNRGGQSYGFVLYRSNLETPKNPTIQIMGNVRDMATVIVDEIRQTDIFASMNQINDFGFWGSVDGKRTLNIENGKHVLDILVENMGRNNFGFSFSDSDQRKGLLTDTVKINNEFYNGSWNIFVLDFQPEWVSGLSNWVYGGEEVRELKSPTMFKAYLNLDDIHDTFIDMRGWGKGVVFVNGFNIGRYFSIGPQLTLYVPAPLFKKGKNTIIIFELFTRLGELSFSSKAIYSS